MARAKKEKVKEVLPGETLVDPITDDEKANKGVRPPRAVKIGNVLVRHS